MQQSIRVLIYGELRIVKILGGKYRTRNQICSFLSGVRSAIAEKKQRIVPYWEPFVGGGWILEKMKGGPIYASDANGALIELWRSVVGGWQPPTRVIEFDYRLAKEGHYTAHETAFIAIGCSFGGKWFGGYARDGEGGTRNYAGEASRSLQYKANRFDKSVHFFAADFLTCYVPAYGCLIYCDPPYAGTTGYGNVPIWDVDKFWKRVRLFERRGHVVIVSEYEAPDDFSCVLEIPTKIGMETKSGDKRRVERLFRWGDHPNVRPDLGLVYED